MSPSLPASARAAGPRLTDAAQATVKQSKWTCHECGAFGYQPNRKAAERAWDHHILSTHAKGA